MTNVIQFPRRRKRATDLSVLIWGTADRYHVTVFEHGYERETQTFRTYEDANASVSFWIFQGATIEDRIAGGDGAA